MTFRLVAAAAVTASLGALTLSAPAHALTSKECSAKYKAAQAAGTTGSLKYSDYRKAECGTGASATPAAAPTTQPSATPAAGRTTPARTPAAPDASKPQVTPDAVFPNTVSAKYSTESAGKARMHTCLDQYNANKGTNGNGGLKWIQKGGGYYSECNRRLKG
jgi:hypothetical protein